jgi:hypothetical protein
LASSRCRDRRAPPPLSRSPTQAEAEFVFEGFARILIRLGQQQTLDLDGLAATIRHGVSSASISRS